MLFNKRLLQIYLNKFEFPANYDFARAQNIISKWQEAVRNGNYDRTKEEQVQSTFLTRFFGIILGYNEMHDSPNEWYLINEAKTEIDGTKADGALGYFSKNKNITRAVIELKDANTPLDKKQSTRKDYDSPVSQAFSYSSKFDRCDWIIVSNFKEIRLYNKDRGQGYYESFEILKLDDEKEFKRFYFCLSKQNLLDENRNSLLDRLVKDTSKNEEEITKDFYKDYKNLRKFLFEHICEHNPNIDKKCLLEKTQKLLDRLVFVMFCEDSNISLLPPFTLKNYYETGKNLPIPTDEKIWPIIKGLFTSIDKGNSDVKPPINRYNGGLFAYDEILDNIKIKDSAWEEVIKLANYDFESDLNVNILGHIFEQSLNDLEQIKAEIDGIEQDKQKSKRKKDGIFYTPEYITRYIVEQTIGAYLEENPDKLETIKILDPACGSGAFLNQAHTFLQKQYKIRTEEKINSEKSLKRGGEEFVKLNLFEHQNMAEVDRSILLNNIYGVDLNSESTEITKLALWLKTAKKDEPLQNLDANIKCGNSLIDDPNVAGDKAFNWNEEFKDIMDDGGFDFIIGNPPYVFTRTQGYEEDLKNYYYKLLIKNQIKKDQQGKNIQSGKLNLYTWFILKSLELLKENGVMAFIIPNGLLRTTTYDLVRKYLLEHTKILKIIDLGENIFENVTISTIIIILEKSTQKDIILNLNNQIEIITNIENFTLQKYQKHNITQGDFYKNTSYTFNILIDKHKSEINNLIKKNSIELGQISKYIIEGIVGSIERDVSNRQEDERYKPFVVGKDIGRYTLEYKNVYIRYDRKLLHRARPEEIFINNKILIQRISGGNMPIKAYLDKKQYYAYASLNILQLKKEVPYCLEYILALINSKLLNWFYTNNFSNKSNLTVNISKTFLEKLPIKQASIEQQQIFLAKVNMLLELNRNLLEEKQKAIELIKLEYKPQKISQNLEKFYTLGVHPFIEELEKQKVKLSLSQKEELIAWYKEKSEKLNQIQSEIDKLDKTIDQEVYKLYNLTEEEIKIIENNN